METEVLTDQTVIQITEYGNHLGSVVLAPWNGGYWVYLLFVEPQHRRKGVGAQLIQKAREHADGSSLFLRPEQWADGPMSTSLLISWYRRLGFEDMGYGVMAG